jgi:probable F420-dependent oxidoreductase
MRLGVTMFATDRTMAAHELAAAAEERGFASLYVPEHTHIPVARTTPAPTGDETLPEEYRRTLDPFVALAAAAAVTSRITLATGICLLAQREPIVTAKAIATLDQISLGRFVLGVGYGWNVEEAADHDVPWRRRREVVREKVLAMRELWSHEEASFQGEFVRFEPSWAWPKPGRVPIMLGGAAGTTLLAHVAEYGDGWLPIGGRGVRQALPRLAQACESRDRDPATVSVVPMGTDPTPEKLDYYAGLSYRGLDIPEVVLRLPSAPRDEVLPILDAYAKSYPAYLA